MNRAAMLAALIPAALMPIVPLSVKIASIPMEGNRQSLAYSISRQNQQYDISFYKKVKKTEYTVSSRDGYVLHAELLENPEKSNDYVILTHGFNDTRYGSLKYARLYLRLGFNCIIYDLRGHGENDRTFVTYGIRESIDLLSMIQDARLRFPDIEMLGLHGESLGSATTVTCMKYKPEVDFAVADCGLAEIEKVLQGKFRNRYFGAAAVALGNIGAKIRYKYAFTEMHPIDALDDNEVPILFIHGGDDRLITPDHSRRMSERTKGYSEMHIIPGAKHANSAIVSPERYEEILRAFLSRLKDQKEKT